MSNEQSPVVHLDDLKAAADEYRKLFKVGDRVVIDNSYSGIWAELTGLTGTISAINKSYFHTFTIDIDQPQLLSQGAWAYSEDGGYCASISGGGIHHLNECLKEYPELAQTLNRDLGIKQRPTCDETPELLNFEIEYNRIRQPFEKFEKDYNLKREKHIALRIQYIDNDPKIFRLETLVNTARNVVTNYQSDRNTEEFKLLTKEQSILESKFNEAWNIRKKWVYENVREYREAFDAVDFKIWQKEHNQYMDELKKLICLFLGRRHLRITTSRKPKWHEKFRRMMQIWSCKCGWNFSLPVEEED